ncbi:MAG: GDP-mannose 4,6-dehydratase, partial [Flavobacteriales bacterium]|nr:GDP-mannose 4,6-dehydratase [Flavobacteriales bacterium]
FGDDYDTKDGSCVRDYINVVDLAKAHVTAVKRLISGQEKNNIETYNLGTGNGVTVLEMIKAFEKVSGEKLNYKIAPRRPGDVSAIYADVSYARDELKWESNKTLEETVLSAWNWEKNLQARNNK